MDEKVEQIQTDNQVVAQTETKQEEQVPVPEQEKSFKDKVTGWIKDKFTAEPVTETAGESGEAEEQYNQAVEQFVAAAREQGWPDNEIENFAVQYSGAELLELIPHLKTQQQEKEQEQTVEKQEDKTESKPEDKDETDALLEKLLPKLQERLGITDTKAAVEELKAERESQRFISDTKKADELMDDWSKQFPELGLRKDLPVFPAGENKGLHIPTSPQFKARSELYSYAIPYLREGQSVDEAMTNARYTYKGKYMEKNVERDLIKDLKKHEQRLSGPRTAKEVKKIYANDREEGLDVVRELLQQGLE